MEKAKIVIMTICDKIRRIIVIPNDQNKDRFENFEKNRV